MDTHIFEKIFELVGKSILDGVPEPIGFDDVGFVVGFGGFEIGS
jgi:hypothetical protein